MICPYISRAAATSLAKVRERSLDQLNHLHAGMKRLINPHRYPVGLERGLFETRAAMIEKLKAGREQK